MPRTNIELRFRPPIQFNPLLDFLAARAIPGVEEVEGKAYRRSVRLDSGGAVVEVRPAEPGSMSLSIESETRIHETDLQAVGGRVAMLLDLDADPAEVDGHLTRSEILRPLVAARPGLRLPGAFDGFELGVRAILGQQVSVAGASTLTGRLVAKLGDPAANSSGTITTLFPLPHVVADADLSGLGVPGSRLRAIKAFAAAIRSGDITLDGSIDGREIRARLMALPGVGPWTAEYIAMRALHDPDAYPETDLGIRKALARLGISAHTQRVTDAWRPWRAYGAMHLWQSLGDTRA